LATNMFADLLDKPSSPKVKKNMFADLLPPEPKQANVQPEFYEDTPDYTKYLTTSHAVSSPVVQPTQPSTWDQVKAGDIKGLINQVGLGLSQGLANTGAAKQNVDIANMLTKNPLPGMADIGKQQLAEIQANQDYLKANPAESLPAILGKEIPSLPLWMAGEGAVGALGKGIGKLFPSVIPAAEKVGSKLPSFIKGGLTDAAAYGGVVAPTQNIQEGGSFQDLLEREKQIPSIALGGAVARGAFKGIGEGAKLGKDVLGEGGSLRQALELRKLNIPEIKSNPLDDVQNAYKPTFSLQDIKSANPVNRSVQRGTELGTLRVSDRITPQYKARQSELTDTFKDLPIGSTKTPLARNTLQENIDSSMGISKPTEVYQGLDAFGKPLQNYKLNTDAKNTIAEITDKMDKKVQDIAKSMRQADGQTKVDSIRSQVKARGGIKQGNADIFEEQKVIPNWIRNDKGGMALDQMADEMKMSTDELLRAIDDSAYSKKDYITEAYRVAYKDPEYQALSNTLDKLKADSQGKVKLLRKDKITTPDDFPFPIKDIPIIRYQKEVGPATYSDLRGGTWYNRVDNVHGENTGYNADDSAVGGMNKLAENYTPKKPLLVKDTESAGAGDAAIRAIKGEKYLDDVYEAYFDGQESIKTLLGKFGIPEQEATLLMKHPEQPQVLLDRVGTELAKQNGYDSIVHTTPNGLYAEIVKLDSSPGRIKAIDGPIKLKPRELTPKTTPEILPIESFKRLKPSGSLPVDEVPRPVKKLTPVAKEKLIWTNKDGIGSSGAKMKDIPKRGEVPGKLEVRPTGVEGAKIGDWMDPKLAASVHPVADKVMTILDDIESSALARIKSNKGRISAGLPVDTLIDYSILGGVKIARGAVKFSVWSAEMIKDLGDEVKPHLKEVWAKAKEQHATMVDGTFEPNIPAGTKERGFSKNTRTDINNPDALRDSYTTDALWYKQLGNKDVVAKAQAIFDQGFESARTQLTELASRMKPEAVPLAKMLSRKATEDGNILGSREIIADVAERLTQAGQFSQAAKILRDADPETFLLTIGKQLKKLNKEGAEQYGKKWSNVELTPDELTMVSSIERGNQASYESAFEQIQARIANEMPASAFEKINAWRHLSMLLNIKTHVRNILGNGIMMGMRKSAQRVSGVLQKVALPEAERTQSVLVSKEYKGLANDYFEANKKDLLSGANKFQEGMSLRMPDKRVFRKSRIGEKFGKDIDVLEKTRKLNYKLLQWGDNPFYKAAYVDRIASYAQSKGIKDFSKLEQEAFDIAEREAQQATYRDASVIATFLNKVKSPEKGASIGRKTGAVLTEAALPFTKTPINLIKRGIQYSPIGVMNGLAGIKSSKGAVIAIDELAKGLTGTGILGLGYLLASKGVLTGKAEKDIDLKAYNANTGNSPFSVLGKYSYDWAQPFSVPLSVGVEIFNAIKDKPNDMARMNGLISKNDSSKFEEMALTAANGIMEGLNASGDVVFNMSIMKGIKTLLGSGYNGFMEGMAQLPQGYATQFIPTLSSQIAGTIDPVSRQTYVKGSLPGSMRNALVSRIPVASTTLQPRQTPFGTDMKKIENPAGRAFSQFLSPGIITKDQGINPKVDSELRRLNKAEGLSNQLPTMVPNYIEKTQKHPKIGLSPEETTRYQKRVGQLTLASFGKIINSGAYKNARANKAKGKSADEIKADMLATAVSDAKALAKKEILKGKGLK